jgi:hypothetical protein
MNKELMHKNMNILLLGLLMLLVIPIGSASAMVLATNLNPPDWTPAVNDAFMDCYNVTGDNPWNPAFLSDMSIYKVFRFKDWDLSDEQTHSNWAGRRQKSDLNQSEPVAYEWMIDLSNRLGADMWVSVYHATFDDQTYWTNLATLIKNNLNSNLKVYVEYSNECCWNYHVAYCNSKGAALGLGGDEGDRFYVYASVRLFAAFESVFGTNSPRLVKVIAGQCTETWRTADQLAALNDSTINPNHITANAYAIAPYFTGTDMSNEIGWVTAQVAALSGSGLSLICYEGGSDDSPAINRASQMYTTMTTYLNDLAPYISLYVHYTNVRPYDTQAYGAKEYTGQPNSSAHKYRAMLDYGGTPNPPGQASSPSPANGATSVGVTTDLSWTAGSGATSHDVYFGTAATPPLIGNQTATTYDTGTMANSTTYYWRINEKNASGTTTGVVWSFTTQAPAPPGQASSPSPANAATGVSTTATLSWTAGSGATSHDVYFGTATTPPFIQNQTAATYNPGTMAYTTTYRWKIDEKNAVGTTTGVTWSFTTAGLTPTFVAAGAVASGTGAITPALPAGIATNDILLLSLETANQAISISNQNGGTWTEVTNSPQGTGTAAAAAATRLTVFWSRYNGTQGAPTTSDSGNHQLGRIIAVRGATTSGNPWNVTAGGVEATADTSGAIPGATTTVTDTLVVAAIATALPDATGTANFSAWANSNLTSITERTDNTVTAGNGGGLGIATGVKATAGAYGDTTVTVGTSAAKGMMSIALTAAAPQPPGQASNPSPANAATGVSTTATLSWTAGSGATSHDVYFGTAASPPFIQNQTAATYNPGTMANSTTYRWKIDEKNASGTTTGVVWSFTTAAAAPPGQATNPSPANAATGVSTTATLSWTAGSGATSHDVYFGTAASPPFIQNQTAVTYNPGTMANSTTYRWKIDEKNAVGTTTGVVWSFTTAAGGGVVFSDSDFAATIHIGNFTAGSSILGEYYSGMAGATRKTSGGNPGNWLSFALWNNRTMIGIAAPSSAEVWNFSFDWIYNTSTAYDTPTFRVVGLTNGQTRDQTLGGGAGTVLGSLTLPVSQSSWINRSLTSVTIPAGYSVILIEWYTDADSTSVGVDNVSVTKP